jgi:hypothetical protein
LCLRATLERVDSISFSTAGFENLGDNAHAAAETDHRQYPLCSEACGTPPRNYNEAGFKLIVSAFLRSKSDSVAKPKVVHRYQQCEM